MRNAVYVDSATATIDVISDSIPHILHGLLLGIRDIRVLIDKPHFVLNPTSCEAKSVDVSVVLAGEDLVVVGDDRVVELSNRFQVGNCVALGFQPKLRLRLFGGVKRGEYQGLRAVVRPRVGEANISRAVVKLPRSAFLDQAHIRTICTRVQFAQKNCPKGAIYGRAVAFSPLVDGPLTGPVYLRSSIDLSLSMFV